jgi:chemotaxis signal transduction protein
MFSIFNIIKEAVKMKFKHKNKFLTFLLDDECYGISILDVKEIMVVYK